MQQPETSSAEENNKVSFKRQLKILWHRLFGKLLEVLLTPVGIGVKVELPVMSDPPKADVLLLRREGRRWTAAQRALLPDGVRDSSASHILLECKFTESVNGASFQQALGYDFFYQQAQELSASDLQTFVISRQTPLATTLAEYGYTVTAFPGVYHSHYPLLNKIDLLVLNELSDESHNTFVKLFASRQQVRARSFGQLARISWRVWSEQLWDIIFALRTLWGVKGDEMSDILTVDRILEIGEQMRKQVVASASPEERLAGLTPAQLLAKIDPQDLQRLVTKNEQVRKQVIASAPPEERLAGLEPQERLAGLTAEECKTLIAQIEAYLQQADTGGKLNNLQQVS